MYCFSKLSTASSAVLGSLGIIASIIPYGLKESSPFREIFIKPFISSLATLDLDNLKNTEKKEINNSLIPLFEKLKDSLEHTIKSQKDKQKEIVELFSGILGLESSLKEIYENNVENFKKLEEVSKKLSDLSTRKLELQAQSAELSDFVNIQEQVRSVFSSLSTSFSSLNDVIKKNSTSSGGGTGTSGGVQTEGQKAQETLKEVQSNFEKIIKNIQEAQSKLSELKVKAQIEQLETLIHKWENNWFIELYKKLLNNKNVKIRELDEQSRSMNNQLNEKYKQLVTSNDQLEHLKKLITEFHKYKSIFLRSICSKSFSDKTSTKSICKAQKSN